VKDLICATSRFLATMISHPEFGAKTTATEVAKAFGGEITGKVGEYALF